MTAEVALDDDGEQFCAIPGCDYLVGKYDIALCNNCMEIAVDVYERYWRERQRAEKRIARAERLGWLYVIAVGDQIKVGYAVNPWRRLKQYPPNAVVLATRPNVTMAHEQQAHAELTQHRVAGREWYRDCPEMREYAARIVAEHGEPIKLKRPDTHRRRTATIGGSHAGSVVTGFTV